MILHRIATFVSLPMTVNFQVIAEVVHNMPRTSERLPNCMFLLMRNVFISPLFFYLNYFSLDLSCQSSLNMLRQTAFGELFLPV